MSVRFFEDFEVGQIFTAGGIKLSLEEIMEFARNYDPQPFHVDIDYAEKFQYGGIIASGFHTMAVTMRLFVDTGFLGTSSLGSPGIESIQFVCLRYFNAAGYTSDKSVIKYNKNQ